MELERIKEIQQETAYPESMSVKKALMQVRQECEIESELLKDRLMKQIKLLKKIINNGLGPDDFKE